MARNLKFTSLIWLLLQQRPIHLYLPATQILELYSAGHIFALDLHFVIVGHALQQLHFNREFRYQELVHVALVMDQFHVQDCFLNLNAHPIRSYQILVILYVIRQWLLTLRLEQHASDTDILFDHVVGEGVSFPSLKIRLRLGLFVPRPIWLQQVGHTFMVLHLSMLLGRLEIWFWPFCFLFQRLSPSQSSSLFVVDMFVIFGGLHSNKRCWHPATNTYITVIGTTAGKSALI